MGIVCNICGRVFGKIITNSHLKTHSITTAEYKLQFGDDSLSTPEYKSEVSAKYSGENNPNYGKRHSWTDEQKAKLIGKSPANKGKKLTDTTAHKNASRRREERYKSGELIRHKPVLTDEIKKKISAGVIKYAKENPDLLAERTKRGIATRQANGKVRVRGGWKHTEESKKKISETSTRAAMAKRERAMQVTKDRIATANLELLGGWAERIITLKCNVCGSVFSHTRQVITESKFKTELCSVCFPRRINRSIGEMELYDFIVSICPDAIHNCRTLIKGEVDVFVPSHGITFEYNGLYWHSADVLLSVGKTHTADFEKHELLESRGFRNIVVFEDEWVHHRDIVKSRIRNLLGQTSKKIYARECTLRKITSTEAASFCNSNHAQGAGRSNARYGLFYHHELVSVMTFSKSNISRKIYSWELNRFCSKLDYSVVFGATRLFTAFLRDYNPETVVTYADRRWSKGDLYATLGFVFSKNTVPNYWYCYQNTCKRIHRYALRKTTTDDTNKTEKEIRREEGYIIIYDCGSSKWVWTKQV